MVLVHGLWFRAWSQRVLAERLTAQGFRCSAFSYPTTRRSLAENASALGEFCRRHAGDDPVLHLVGHSLGGLLILRMLEHQADLPPGRIVFLGTPLRGSGVARRLGQWPMGEALLGAARDALGAGHGHWPADRDVGLVAGTRPVGLGRAVGGLEGPNDGTVSVAETQHRGLADRAELAVTHTGMLYSGEVADQAAHFLAHGRF